MCLGTWKLKSTQERGRSGADALQSVSQSSFARPLPHPHMRDVRHIGKIDCGHSVRKWSANRQKIVRWDQNLWRACARHRRRLVQESHCNAWKLLKVVFAASEFFFLMSMLSEDTGFQWLHKRNRLIGTVVVSEQKRTPYITNDSGQGFNKARFLQAKKAAQRRIFNCKLSEKGPR